VVALTAAAGQGSRAASVRAVTPAVETLAEHDDDVLAGYVHG